MVKQTVNDAIINAIKKAGRPLTAKEIMDIINRDDLYRFKTANPENIVRNQLRRHSENVTLGASSKVKHFVSLDGGKYWLSGIPEP